MALIKVETFKSPTFPPGNANTHRVAIQAEMNAFLATIAPIDVLQFELDYVPDGKYAEEYTYIGRIVYYVP